MASAPRHASRRHDTMMRDGPACCNDTLGSRRAYAGQGYDRAAIVTGMPFNAIGVAPTATITRSVSTRALTARRIAGRSSCRAESPRPCGERADRYKPAAR
jgi:hypothetical protein